MTKYALLLALGLVALGGCARQVPAPEPIDPCAISTEEGQTDGGYGGTGNAPEDCPPAQ